MLCKYKKIVRNIGRFLKICNLTFPGRTPLHSACNSKQFEVARLLVSSGCITSAHDLLGRPPIIEAARLKEAATLNLLLKANGPSYSQEFIRKLFLEIF